MIKRGDLSLGHSEEGAVGVVHLLLDLLEQRGGQLLAEGLAAADHGREDVCVVRQPRQVQVLQEERLLY